MSRITSKSARACLLAICGAMPFVAKAVDPYWDINNPGTITSYTFQFPMVAKSGILYLPLTYQTLHISQWEFGYGYSDLGQLYPVGDVGGWVNSMCIHGAYIYVAGYFTMLISGGVTATNIAAYDSVGKVWTAVGDGTLTDEIWAVAVDSNGRVYVGAGDDNDHGASTSHLLRYWSGSAWTTAGAGMYGSATDLYGYGKVTALAANGTDVYAAGNFDSGVNANSTVVYSTNIIKFDGSSWHAMGTPAGNGVVVAPNSESTFKKVVVSGTNVFVTGTFQNSGPSAPVGLDRFSVNCSHVQSYILSLTSDNAWGNDLSARNGIVYLAGRFDHIDSTAVTGVAQWRGGWSALGSGVNAQCYVAAADADDCEPGDMVFVWGDFDHAGGYALPNGSPVRWIPETIGQDCGS